MVSYYLVAGCNKDDNPKNGNALASTDESGEIINVAYSCNKGYHLIGNKTRECDHGSLTGDPPICQGKAIRMLYSY